MPSAMFCKSKPRGKGSIHPQEKAEDLIRQDPMEGAVCQEGSETEVPSGAET